MVKQLVLLIALAGVAHAAPPQVRHVPPAEADAGKTLELVADAPSTTPTLLAHYRTVGAGQWEQIELVRRDAEQWVAVVPAIAVVAPGVEYYLDAGGAPVFASAATPHVTRVAVTTEQARRARDEQRAHGRRYRLGGTGQWVDYGTHTVGGSDLTDRYYRLDGSIEYRLWAYPLDTLRGGTTRLLGDAGDTQAGFKASGWFELGLVPVDGLGIDARGIALATQGGFNVGGRLELRLGDRDGTHVASGAEYLADVGTSGFFRFGWGTVPRAPMSATVEVTTLPASDRDIGVRLYYDVIAVISDGVRIGLRAGYAARDQSVAGYTAGLSTAFDF